MVDLEQKKIGFISKQRKGKKEVTNWQVVLNFILINLAEIKAIVCVITVV